MKNMLALMLCSVLSMIEVIMLEITSSLQKSSRKLQRSMAVPALVAVLRESTHEARTRGRGRAQLNPSSPCFLQTDS